MALAPLAELVAPPGYEWACSFVALVLVCAVAGARPWPLAALWLLSAWRYSAHLYVVLLNAASGALLVAVAQRHLWASREARESRKP